VRKNPVLVDTDVFIDYLNHRLYRSYFEGEMWQVYYSIVTKKELLAKCGLSDRERQAIHRLLKRYRRVSLTQAIIDRFSDLRRIYPSLEREDALIAASAPTRQMPLLTGNRRHFSVVTGLLLLVS
jgi:predicted nucleic acid-binding protein